MFNYIDLKPNSKDASVIEWYKDSPKLLRANNLILSGLLSSISTVNAMPLYVEFIELFLSKVLKLNGHPFFKTSFASCPSSSMIAREWDKSVTAKSVSLKTSIIFLSKSFFVDTKSQFFGPFHKILVITL